jgi:hypothetical protein
MMFRLPTRAIVATLVSAALFSVVLFAQTNQERFTGKPEFSSGDALGYFVWRDDATWKLRWTTFGNAHRFTGRIVVEGGELRDFKRVDVDEERRVLAPGRPARVVRGPRGRAVGVRPGRGAVVATRVEDRIVQETERLIVFNTETDDDLDGLDFKVTPATTMIRLNLEIDGRARPEEVEVGRGNFKPNENPLVIRFP